MTWTFDDRTVLVTGGSGQLGRHVVAYFLRRGARVHVPVFDPDERTALDRFLETRQAADGERLVFHPDGDLADPDRVAAIFREVASGPGGAVEILLNLAGGFAMAPIEETDPALWERMWRMNASTAFLCSKAAFPAMKAAGRGRIVNVSALPAVERGQAELSAYGAAKAAVLNLTWSLAREGAPHGITVNAVLPSIIDTPENREAMPDADPSTWVPPDEIAKVLGFLASDEARTVSGAELTLSLG